MKLYNVSFNLNNPDRILSPTIPKTAADDENKTYRRVCLADSVEHCIQAIAVENKDIRAGAKIIVRTVDTKNLYKQFLVGPQTLFDKKLVPDALENNEYWYLQRIKFDLAVYTILDFDADFEIAWSLIKIDDCKKIVHKWLPNFTIGRYKIPKNLYIAAMKECERLQNWDAEDGIWDDLAELPWAQKTGIYNIKLRKERTL